MKELSFGSPPRPVVTLFMLMSVDGKISTGCGEAFDFDTDIPSLFHASKGLHQYYALEQETSLWTIGSGATQVKVLKSVALEDISPIKANVVVVDNHHVTTDILVKLSRKFNQVVIVSTEGREFACLPSNVTVEVIPAGTPHVPVRSALTMLCKKYNVEEICLQGGGTLNASFFNFKLVDFLEIVVAPIVVGGSNVPTLVDGINPVSLNTIGELNLLEARPLEDNYLYLRYRVLK